MRPDTSAATRPKCGVRAALTFLYKRFVRKDRDPSETTVVYSADTVEMAIPRGLAGPGMLADTIVRRWQDHQPFNRLEGIYAREGLDRKRCTDPTFRRCRSRSNGPRRTPTPGS